VVLPEHAHLEALGDADRALVGLLLPGDDLEQRGLARAVGPHQRVALAGVEGHRDVLEEDLRPVALGEAVEGDHGGGAFWFWQQLALALVLHPMIHTLVILDHMDCGAYKRLLALGDDDAKEKKAHREITRALAEEVTRRHPGLTVTRWLLEPSPPTQEHDWCARDLQTNKLHHNVKCVHEGS
jgi:hypothetical protein